MSKRNDTHIQVLLPEIKAMPAEGKTQREIAEYYGFKDKQVVKKLLKRERRKERKPEAGILPRPQGRPRKSDAPRDIVAEQAYEIRRLRMENGIFCNPREGSESKGKVCSNLPSPETVSCTGNVSVLCSVQKRLLQLCKADEATRKRCCPC